MSDQIPKLSGASFRPMAELTVEEPFMTVTASGEFFLWYYADVFKEDPAGVEALRQGGADYIGWIQLSDILEKPEESK
jgi:hypothetical protein